MSTSVPFFLVDVFADTPLTTGDVLAEDHNTVVTEQDITAHPELKLAPASSCRSSSRPEAVSPDAAEVAYEGPALLGEARIPIDGYYA